MGEHGVQDVYAHLAGQDDNLGDSLLRDGFLRAARRNGRRFHLYLESPSSDYISGLTLTATDRVYPERRPWVVASEAAARPVLFFNAGEINPRNGPYPSEGRSAELRRATDRGGVVIVAGVGLRNPATVSAAQFDPVFRDCAVVSWRDEPSRDAAGFGDVAPDWAYALGSDTSAWAPAESRPLLAVTLRFDRPWPEATWFEAVREFAARTGTRIVTLAQVARDAPRAVHLAETLGGEYLIAPSTRHADLDAHVRAIYGQTLAVVSDRAHALIIGATEGAYPVGSAADPQKLSRLLAVAGLGQLVGRHHRLAELTDEFESHHTGLAAGVDAARAAIAQLGTRIRAAMDAVA